MARRYGFPIDRRTVLAGLGASGVAALAGCASVPGRGQDAFIRRDGTGFTRGGRPYRWTGGNAWYFAWLGADAAYGDRARLGRVLDRLKAIGVTNLRIMASGEEGPVKNSIKPGFIDAAGAHNTVLLEGLDYAMAEIGRRGMVAVLCLSNFWEWSGGMMNRLARATGQWTDMNDPAKPWPAFPDAVSAFYSNEQAKAGHNDWVRAMVGRINSVTGTPYA
jgi:mannan endo-1,4-beta-mannosidase